jgi:hypothetical protein
VLGFLTAYGQPGTLLWDSLMLTLILSGAGNYGLLDQQLALLWYVSHAVLIIFSRCR